MKKFTLFFVATLFSALSFAALNPFAYGLSSSLDGTTLKVNYSLNADATGVSIVILDGETEVHTLACDGKTKGSHSVDISTLGLPTGKSLTWKVVVKGAAVANATAVKTYRFFHPSGIDIDNNPESKHFGRILCLEANHSVKTTTSTNGYLGKGYGAGIYAFDAAFDKITNGSDPGFNGGNTFTTTHYAVRRVRISDDGRIFVTAQNNGGCFLWEIDPDNLNSWTKVFKGTEGTYTTTTADGKFIAGTNSGFDVHGSGENLKLVMLSASKSGANVSTFRCDEYDLGTKTEWSTVPSRTIPGANYHIVTSQSNVQYDKDGSVWHIQYRGTCDDTNPGLVHYTKDGEEDFKWLRHYTRNAGFCFNKDYTKVIVAGKFQNGTGTQKYATIYAVSKDVNGKPVFTEELVVDMTNIGYALNDFAWDWADNIYAVDNNGEYLCAYALPHAADKVVSTPCASKYAFEVEEIVANVYTLTTNVVGEGTIEGNEGSYVEGTTATLTASPADHYDFVNWTGDVTSTDNPLTITVNSDLTVTANFQEHTKYTITAHAADNTMGYVTGGKAYYAGETVTLKAVANSTYYFVNWSDGVTDAIRTFTATADVTLTANFAKASPRAWAYDLKVAEDGDNYKFSFNATTAAAATLLFADKEGNALAPTSYDLGAINAGLNTATVAKSLFTEPKDIYWSVKMDGEAIPAVAEITDQSRNIYDFYNMQGVVVDNDPNSEKFGEIYIEMAKSGTTNGKAQTLGLFLLNQNLDVLNTNPNVGIQPTMPSGYALNGTNYTFQRLNIHPKTGDLVFSYGISSKPAVFAIDRENMTSSVTNLLDGITGLTKTVAHCFDEDGALYVMDIVSYKGTIYKIKDGVKSTFSPATGKYAADNITMTSDGRGGLWVAQNRGQIDACYQLAHVNSEGVTDWSIYDDQGGGTSSTGFTGYSTRGALAYDVERQILAQGRNSTVEVFQVAYDATTGVPTLTKIATTPQVNKANIDGLAFDYAGDLYMVNSGTEKFYKYTLPTAENICTVPAPESQKIVKEVRHTVTVNVVGNGEVEGAGEYIAGTSVALTATPAEHHRFIGWTGDKTSMDNPLEFVAESNITLTATFEAIRQYTITVSAKDGEMGSVTGGGTYYEGSTATLTATPVGGYVFEKWSDNNTDNPRTITVSEAATYTAIFKVAPARVFAYDLDVVDNGNDTYTLSFVPNTNAVSGRVILYNDDTKEQIHEAPIAGTIAKGVKSEVVVSKSVMPTSGTVTWAVELTGEPVEKLTLLTKANDKANYGFNRPQGVAIDNNPASDFFGRIYIALPKAGGTGYTDTNHGIVVMDPQHNRLKSGVVANGDAWGDNGRYSMHRVAVNPTNGHVYYVRTADNSEGVTGTAIYELTPDATNILTDGGAAKNVISGASDITNANSVCFEEDGTMYVVANANYTNEAGSTGRVYKVVDGTATLVTPNSIKLASKANSIVSDGRGGFWLAQHRNNFDTFSHLIHINESGAADYTIDKNSTDASLLPVQTFTSSGTTYTNASYRGQVAYYAIDENNGLVAYGGGAKVSIFKATYNGSGVPSLTAWKTISMVSQSSTAAINVDGIAFDYAGNIVILSATDERMYQYALPLESENTSLVPSPTSKTIKLGTLYNVELAVNDNAMGTATGAGEFLAGETATVTATANPGYRFVNWTYGSETSTANPLSIVVAGNITVTANFEPLPEIAYELNGGQWNQYGWTSKKDMYNALLDDWRAYSGSTRTNKSYEEQLGVGNSSKGIPTTVYSTDDRVALWNLFTDPTYASKWGWLATYVDAVAATQYNKMVAANGVKTQPTSAAGVFTFTIGNFFGEDNAHSTDYIDAVDFTGEEAHITAFAPYWGQTFPMPTQPTEEIVLNAPYKEGHEFDGWYTTSDFSGAAVTTVDENTDGTLYAKWIETIITVTIGEDVDNTTNLAPYIGKTVTATVTRSFNNDSYKTITLPFSMDAAQISDVFGDATVLEFINVIEGPSEINLRFRPTSKIVAGTPYIIALPEGEYDAEDGFTIEDVVIDTELRPITFGKITMQPVLDGGDQLTDDSEYWLATDNYLYNVNDPAVDMPGLRAYFISSSPLSIRARVVYEENEETELPIIQQQPENNVRKIMKDGQIIIIRGEQQYNVQGQRID